MLALAILVRSLHLSSELSLHEWVMTARAPAVHDAATGASGYALASRLSAALLGSGPLGLRVPALLFGCMSLFLVWRWALRLTTRGEAQWTTALLAASANHLWYSQNASGHTAALCLMLYASLRLDDLLHGTAQARARHASAYMLGMGAAIWMHPSALLALVGHAAGSIGSRGRSNDPSVRPTRWAMPGAIPAALIGALLAALALRVAFCAGPALALGSDWGHDATRTTGVYDGWRSSWLVPGLPEELSNSAKAVGAALLIVLVVLGMRSHARQGAAARTLVLGPVAAALLFAVARWDLALDLLFASGPGLCLLFVRGISNWVRLFLRSPALTPLAGGMERLLWGLACGIASAGLGTAYGPKQDFQAAQTWLAAHAAAAEPIASAGRAGWSFDAAKGARWSHVDSAETLKLLEARGARPFVVRACERALRRENKALAEHLEREYGVIRSFPGTLRGCEVEILQRRMP